MIPTRSAGCHAHNVGASILRQVGLADLIATSEEEFVSIAVALSNDHQRLQQIKSTLRETCLGVPTAFCLFSLCRRPEFVTMTL